jgi:hypothetical protein
MTVYDHNARNSTLPIIQGPRVDGKRNGLTPPLDH